MSSGMAVSAADPSGLWGLLKEGLASAGAITEAGRDAHSSELIKAIASDFATSQGRSLAQDGLRKKLQGAKLDEAQLLDRKAPEEAVAVKTWLRTISQRVAQAASEGGVLGVGGVQVSEAEKASKADIAKALNLSV
jgi:hypothetical protein